MRRHIPNLWPTGLAIATAAASLQNQQNQEQQLAAVVAKTGFMGQSSVAGLKPVFVRAPATVQVLDLRNYLIFFYFSGCLFVNT